MKKTLIALAFMCAAMFSLSASAQIITNYSNSIHSLNNARSFQYDGWVVTIAHANKAQSTFSNNALTIFNTMVALYGGNTVSTKFTRITGTNLYVNTSLITSVYCSGTKTQIVWDAQDGEIFNDNCELFGKVKAASINPLNY